MKLHFFLIFTLLSLAACEEEFGTPVAEPLSERYSALEVRMLELPRQAREGQLLTVSWSVSGLGSIEETELVIRQEENMTSSLGQHNSGPYPIPDMFSVTFKVPEGDMLYLQARAISDGTEILSSEQMIRIVPQEI